MKWFWYTNYFFTLYFTLVVIPLFFIYTDKLYVENGLFQILYDVLTADNTLFYLSIIIEWMQIPICAGVLIFSRKERSRFKLIYILILTLLSVTKIIIWLIGTSGIYS